MNPYGTSLFLSDTYSIAQGAERLAMVIAVIVIVCLVLHKKSILPQNRKPLVWILIGIWAAAVMLQYAISTHSYFNYTRPLIKEMKRQQTGL